MSDDHKNIGIMEPETELSMDDRAGAIDIVVDLPATEAMAVDQQPKCEICHLHAWKYRCPRCSMRTCSLDCVKAHKKENNCSGERSKTHFVPRKEYDYRTMMSDYVYLEDMARQSDTFTRERTTSNRNSKSKDAKLRLLVRQARQLGILYDVLPAGMSRRKQSQTIYSQNSKQLFWTVECFFCHSDHQERVLEHSISHRKSLREFLNNLLFVENPVGGGSYGAIRHQLRDFTLANMDNLVIGLKKEGQRRTFINVTNLLDLSMADVLRGERIIEFPTFYVWLAGQVDADLSWEEKTLCVPQDSKSDSTNRAEKRDTHSAGSADKKDDGDSVAEDDSDEDSDSDSDDESDSSDEEDKEDENAQAKQSDQVQSEESLGGTENIKPGTTAAAQVSVSEEEQQETV
ncbi:uncharacterized protein BYT42DRAFT_554878 [Radiomyces spectabilis]|uniref:uncharacterized protein n=1 Tax=Radiomyces spectabilis TaxID=64574 RepID=UPI002220DCE3|nr:uncharacterized protein BYT42DRAFT_554878 [Radiomyces spectabilis]KAI8390914.1 hypothetical protein BYT42DRAFT_554878 [Radiomyces spectabilis]